MRPLISSSEALSQKKNIIQTEFCITKAEKLAPNTKQIVFYLFSLTFIKLGKRQSIQHSGFRNFAERRRETTSRLRDIMICENIRVHFKMDCRIPCVFGRATQWKIENEHQTSVKRLLSLLRREALRGDYTLAIARL